MRTLEMSLSWMMRAREKALSLQVLSQLHVLSSRLRKTSLKGARPWSAGDGSAPGLIVGRMARGHWQNHEAVTLLPETWKHPRTRTLT